MGKRKRNHTIFNLMCKIGADGLTLHTLRRAELALSLPLHPNPLGCSSPR